MENITQHAIHGVCTSTSTNDAVNQCYDKENQCILSVGTQRPEKIAIRIAVGEGGDEMLPLLL